jgi:starch synthase
MRILMVAAEARPYASTGGLAEVLGALPAALVRCGHEVDVFLPRYRGVSMPNTRENVTVQMGHRTATVPVGISSGAAGVRTLLLDSPEYFEREHLYGPLTSDYPDNAERFAWLCHAAIAWAGQQDPAYDVLHPHDWHTGLIPALLRSTYAGVPALRRLPTVFTVHNLAYQGLFDPSWMPTIGLPAALLQINGVEFWGRVSFLKAGLQFADILTTVSPRYAQEIVTREYGFGLDGLLRTRAADLIGILNGIDYDQWNPGCDVHLPAPFSASNVEGKAAAKRAALAMLGLANGKATDAPLILMISRLVDQKGFDLVEDAAADLVATGARFAVLGEGEPSGAICRCGPLARWPSGLDSTMPSPTSCRAAATCA